jgi:ribokinase
VAQSLARLDVPAVVVTLGARGCCARVNGDLFFQPAFEVKPVDTTGAGDTFCGVLVAALQQQQTWPQALAAASAAGALACTQPGAQSAIPPHADVLALLSKDASGASTDTIDATNPTQLDPLRQYCGFTA